MTDTPKQFEKASSKSEEANPASPETPEPAPKRVAKRLTKPATKIQHIGTKTVFGLLLIFVAIVGGIVAVIQTYGRSLVLEESERKIEASGNNRVEELSARLRQISALVRSMAELAALLPKDPEVFKKLLPPNN